MSKFFFFSPGAYLWAIQHPNANGGAEKQQWLIAETLAKQGHEVVIVVTLQEREPLKTTINGVRFVSLEVNSLFEYRLLKILATEKPDWWYWRCSSHYLGLLFLGAKLLGVRTVFACAFDSDCNPKHSLANYKRLWPLYALGLALSNCIVVQHSGQLDLLSSKNREKARVVHNIMKMREDHSLVKEQYIAWIASLRLPKRPHILVELAKSLPLYKFIVCGGVTDHRSPPGYSSRIASMLDRLPNVYYQGKVTPEKARQTIARSSIFLSTSSEEGFPNVMLEAWEAGVPVVSLNLDPGGVINKYKLGFVTNSILETKNCLERLLNNPTEIQALGGNARHYVVTMHSPEAVYRQLMKAIEK